MEEMFDNLTPLTMPINTLVWNGVGTFRRREFEEGGLGWIQIDCTTCIGHCDEVIYDDQQDIYLPQSLAPLSTEEFFKAHQIIEILAMPPLWVAEQVGKAMINDLLPTALASHYNNTAHLSSDVNYPVARNSLKEFSKDFNPDEYDWSNKNDRDN